MPITPLPSLDRTSTTFRADTDTFFGVQIPQFSVEAEAARQEISDNAAAAVAAAIGTIAASATTTATLAATTGSKTFTVETGKAIVVGATMTFKQNGNAANSFTGAVTAYNSGTGSLTINATSVTGSSTAAAGWQGVITRVAPDTGTMMVRHEVASGGSSDYPNASQMPMNTWSPRTLNTVTANTIAGASLASNQITLPAGVYEVLASAPSGGISGVVRHKLRLRNLTDSTSLIGTSELNNTTSMYTRSVVEARFTITSAKTFALQHYVTNNPSMGGEPVSSGEVEVYSTVLFRKVG
jgi:hypothetical protein